MGWGGKNKNNKQWTKTNKMSTLRRLATTTTSKPHNSPGNRVQYAASSRGSGGRIYRALRRQKIKNKNRAASHRSSSLNAKIPRSQTTGRISLMIMRAAVQSLAHGTIFDVDTIVNGAAIFARALRWLMNAELYVLLTWPSLVSKRTFSYSGRRRIYSSNKIDARRCCVLHHQVGSTCSHALR